MSAADWVVVPRCPRGQPRAVEVSAYDIAGVAELHGKPYRDGHVVASCDSHVFVAVFSALGAAGAVPFLKEHAHKALLDAGLDPPYWSTAFERLNRTILQKWRGAAGGMAVAAMLRGSLLSVAWVGECGAVLYGCKSRVARRITRSHDVGNAQEVQRLVELGGHCAGGMKHTRAFGDASGRGVTAEPNAVDITLREPSILVLACGGLFSTATKGAFALDPYIYEHTPLPALAEQLVNSALDDGAMGSITVVAVKVSPRTDA